MNLRPVFRDNIEDALAILRRGFPNKPARFWRDGLERLAAYQKDRPLGQLLHTREGDAGIILTIASENACPVRPRTVVNLSSWYMDPSVRWLAPRMLQRVISDDEVIYTDLTPTAAVSRMIGQFGFTRWNDRIVLYCLPWTAFGRRGRADVQPLDRLPGDAFSPQTQRMLEEHVRLGCIAAGLRDGDTLHPLLFSLCSRRAITIARLIYAPAKTLVASHLAAIARFLMRERIPMLAVNARSGDLMPGGRLLARSAPTFFKGAMDHAAINHAYSEFVFFRM
ncbi:MAG: hypothetical protein DPW22_06550 [Alphaproteobacteria bacterium]|nr:hypothetical protein [Alphaproteobacteria bacterium]